MKNIFVICGLLIFCSCSVSLVSNNIKDREIDLLDEKKPTISEVKSKFGAPVGIHDVVGDKVSLKILVYPYDSNSGNMFYCNHVSFIFFEDGDSFKYLGSHKGVPPAIQLSYKADAQARCNLYADQQTQMNNTWMDSITIFAIGTSEALKASEPRGPSSNSQPIACYSNYDCGWGQKCATKKYESSGICIDIYYYNK